MKASQLFSKTKKQAPSDETAKNAQLLIKAGFIHKEMAGVYAYLPLGLRVIENIKTIVREEMNKLGSQELIMTSLQPKDNWTKTDRWDDEKVDVWFKSSLKNGTEVGLGWSHEEPITLMMREHLKSYRDLPTSVFQFQQKMRNETRAKSGIMRTREFVMKDMYSYSRSDAEHKEFYDKAIKAYHNVFERVGLGDDTIFTTASGGAFTQFSHEFQTITEAGEDTIYLDKKKKIAINQEVYTDDVIEQLGLKKDELKKVKAAEVGNIFSFGTAKSEDLGLQFTDEDGANKYVVLGSYGIGVTRLMGVIVEHFADENGLVWPESVAPFGVHIVTIGDSKEVMDASKKLHDGVEEAGGSALWDDTDARPGEKLANADLIGIPHRVVVSEKSLKAGGFEYKARNEKTAKILSHTELKKVLSDS